MAEAAIAPAPATPAATPSPTPSPSPSPGPIPSAPASGDMADAFSELDRMVSGEPEPSPEPKDDAPEPQPKETPKETAPKEPPKPVEQPKVKARDLKEAKEMAQAEAKQWREKYEALEKQAKQQPKEHPEVKTLQERLQSLEKEKNEALEKLRFKSYEEHPEYEEKYNKPFINAFERGRKFVDQLEVITRKNDETGEVTQQGRKATAADFDSIARLYAFNPAEGSRLANQLFGDMAPDVKDHIREAQRLFESRENAKNEWKTKGSESIKAEMEAMQRQSQLESQAYNEAYEFAASKWPDRYQPKEGDAKGNELLTKATDIALRAFTDGTPIKEGQQRLDGIAMAKLRAAVVRQASAYPREHMWRKAAEAKIAELQKQLEGFEKSEPNGGDPKGRPAGIPAEDMESVLNTLTPDYPTRR